MKTKAAGPTKEITESDNYANASLGKFQKKVPTAIDYTNLVVFEYRVSRALPFWRFLPELGGPDRWAGLPFLSPAPPRDALPTAFGDRVYYSSG
jgi:hypothetical protein